MNIMVESVSVVQRLALFSHQESGRDRRTVQARSDRVGGEDPPPHGGCSHRQLLLSSVSDLVQVRLSLLVLLVIPAILDL